MNKQQIFECTEDYEHFVRILQRQCGLPVDTRPSSYNGRREFWYLSLKPSSNSLPQTISNPSPLRDGLRAFAQWYAGYYGTVE